MIVPSDPPDVAVGVDPTATMALITPADGSIQPGRASARSRRSALWLARAAVGTSPARIAASTWSKSSIVALRLPSSDISRLWNSGSEKVMSAATTEIST